MKLKEGFNWPNLILLIVLAIFLFFRFYQINQRVQFDWDQERDAQVAKEILSGHLTLLGPRVLGPDKFFLAPYFYYLLTPFYWLTNLHPRAIIYFLLFYNLVFFFLTYQVLKKLFNRQTAFIFLLFWSINKAAIAADTIAWNPVVVPALVIVFLGILNRILKDSQKKSNWFYLGILLSMGINFHFQIIFLVVLAVIFLLLSKKVNLKGFLTSFLGFSLSFFPLLLFDLRHNFLNTKLFLQFLKDRGERGDFWSWWPVFQNFLSGFLAIDISKIVALFFLFFFSIIAFLIAKKQKAPFLKYFSASSAIFLLIFFLGFAIYGQRPSEYYFNFLIPLLIIIMAEFLKKWRFGFILALILAVFWASQSIALLKPLPFSLENKDQVTKYLAKAAQGQEINIAFSMPLGRDTGYLYLLDYYRVRLSDNPRAPLYKIIIPPNLEPTTFTFGDIGIFVPQ